MRKKEMAQRGYSYIHKLIKNNNNSQEFCSSIGWHLLVFKMKKFRIQIFLFQLSKKRNGLKGTIFLYS